MHRHALAACDVAGDGIGRRRPAAARQRREQRVDADDEHAAEPPAQRASVAARTPPARLFSVVGRSKASMLRSDSSSLPTTSNSASALRKPSCVAKSACLSAVRPSRCSSFSTALAATRDRRGLCQRVEPRPHLGFRARALQIAELGVQPVERRAAGLRGRDLDRLGRCRAACSAAPPGRRPWPHGSGGRDRCAPRRRSRSASPRR